MNWLEAIAIILGNLPWLDPNEPDVKLGNGQMYSFRLRRCTLPYTFCRYYSTKRIKDCIQTYWPRFWANEPLSNDWEATILTTLQCFQSIHFDCHGEEYWHLISTDALSASLENREVEANITTDGILVQTKPARTKAKNRKALVDGGPRQENATEASKDARAPPAENGDEAEINNEQLENFGFKSSKALKKKMQKLAATVTFSNLDCIHLVD